MVKSRKRLISLIVAVVMVAALLRPDGRAGERPQHLQHDYG